MASGSGRILARAPYGIVLCVALLPLACATSPQKAAPPPIQAPLPRSSIAAVLEHRRELELTDEQVRRLQDLDDQLERANAAIRKEANQKQTQSQPVSRAPRGGMGGMGGRSRGGMGRSTGEGRGQPSSPNVPKSAEERIDDNDTNAYLEAEKLLTESQRPLALEIASRFREESWDRQHANNK